MIHFTLRILGTDKRIPMTLPESPQMGDAIEVGDRWVIVRGRSWGRDGELLVTCDWLPVPLTAAEGGA